MVHMVQKEHRHRYRQNMLAEMLVMDGGWRYVEEDVHLQRQGSSIVPTSTLQHRTRLRADTILSVAQNTTEILQINIWALQKSFYLNLNIYY